MCQTKAGHAWQPWWVHVLYSKYIQSQRSRLTQTFLWDMVEPNDENTNKIRSVLWPNIVNSTLTVVSNLCLSFQMNNLNVVSEQLCDISDARLKFRVRSLQPPNYQSHTDKPRKCVVCASVNLWDYRVRSLSHTNSAEESEKAVVGRSVLSLQQLR